MRLSLKSLVRRVSVSNPDFLVLSFAGMDIQFRAQL